MRRYGALALVSVAFFVASFITLSHYGMNWDSPMEFARGQGFLTYLLSKKTTYDQPDRTPPFLVSPWQYISRYYLTPAEMGNSLPNLPGRPLPQAEYRKLVNGSRFSFYEHNAWNGAFLLSNDGPGHLPFPNLLAALSNRIFYQWLYLTDDIGGYQILHLVVASLGVFLIGFFVRDLTHSIAAGVIASVALATYPLFWADAHLNLRDPLQAIFYTATLFGFFKWVTTKKIRWFTLSAIALALALGSKWNIVFSPIIIVGWLVSIRNGTAFHTWFVGKTLLLYSLLASIVGVLFLFLIWPYAWTDPIARFVSVVSYYWDIGIKPARIQPSGFEPWGANLSPLVLSFTQTPEITLALATVGLVGLFQKSLAQVRWLLILWLVVPLVRVSLPGTFFYGGLRQIMEIVPAISLLSGIGFYTLSRHIRGRGTIVFFGVVLAWFGLFFRTLVLYHPNESTYFNTFVGGLGGAVKQNLVDWTITYGSIYRQGVAWINEHAPEGSIIAHLDGSMFAISPLWLRDDISISPFHFSGFERKGEYILLLVNPLDPPVFARRYVERFLRPVHEVAVVGVPILRIYQNSPQYQLVDIAKEEHGARFAIQAIDAQDGGRWEVDLGENVRVTRIRVIAAPDGCDSGIAANEYVEFMTESESPHVSKRYVLNEKQRIDPGKVEYLFPGEVAQKIFVYPLNDTSCFVQGRIERVSFLR